MTRTPRLAADIIIEMEGKIVLIRRKNPPHGWALPGGFVEYGESVEAAAVREAKEETSLDVTLARQLKTYSDPRRDPRGHTVSVVFIGTGSGELHGRDDAAQAGLFDEGSLPTPLCFDHEEILRDYFTFRRGNGTMGRTS